MSEEHLRERIRVATAIVGNVLRYANDLRYEGDPQMQAIMLHATITELMGACIVLAADRDHTIGIPILARSMYEAMVNLDNLLQDPSYIEHMELANLHQTLALLDAGRTNPMLAGLLDGREEDHAAYRARYQELRDAIGRPLSVEQRFARVRRTDEYRSYYAYLCLDTHGNIAALADRHLDEREDGPRVSIFLRTDPVAVASRLDLALRILVTSAVMIHSAFRVRQQEAEGLARQAAVEPLFPPQPPQDPAGLPSASAK